MSSIQSIGLWISKVIFLAFSLLLRTSLINAYEPVAPNTYSCNPGFGDPLVRWPCEIAVSDIPTGSTPVTFSTKAKSENDDWIQLPQRHLDDDVHPHCVVTIDLEGHSQRDVAVMISYDMIRRIAINVIANCIGRHNWGGWETYGLDATFRALIPPAPYDPNVPTQAGVENPDGSVDSIALPEGAGGPNGFSELPRLLNVESNLRDQLYAANYIGRENDIARTLTSFNPSWRSGLLHYNHPRWWEFRLGPPTPHPSNVKLTCAAKLGSPSIANCEAALFQFMRFGHVTLGPKQPLIRTAGNCAIGVSTPTKRTASWDMLRSVAESLLSTCLSNPRPLSGSTGGFAHDTPIAGRRKRQASNANAFPAGFTLSVYLQQPFNGLPSDTCAWDVATSHTGDVRKCPAQTAPWRPPERRIGENETYAITQNGTSAEVVKGNVTYITTGDSTEKVVTRT